MCLCDICYSETNYLEKCEFCEKKYCEDCSYLFTIHFQFQGSMCIICSEQRRNNLATAKVRKNKINYLLKNG